MKEYIDKSALVAEIKERIETQNKGYANGDDRRSDALEVLLHDIDTLEVKEADLDCNSWIPFMPSSDLPKDRVTVAYKTNDERDIRYAYGHFQFRNGNCSMFWKDGNELPATIKNEDIVCWMPVKEVKAQKGESV